MRGLSPVVASGGHSSSRCAGLSLSQPLPLRNTGSRRAGSAIVAHGASCSVACGILPDQGSNPRRLHWQADSQPLRHQGSPPHGFITSKTLIVIVVFYKLCILFYPHIYQFPFTTSSRGPCFLLHLVSFFLKHVSQLLFQHGR